MLPRIRVQEVVSRKDALAATEPGAPLILGVPRFTPRWSSDVGVLETRKLEGGHSITLEGGALFEWETEGRRLLAIARVDPADAWRRHAALTNAGDVAFLCEGSAWIWRALSRKLEPCFDVERSGTRRFQVSGDGEKILLASESDIEVWSARSGSRVLHVPLTGSTKFSGDSSHLLIDSTSVEVWDLHAARCVLRRPPHGRGSGFGETTCVSLNRDGRKLLCVTDTQCQSGSDTIDYTVIDVATGAEIDGGGRSHNSGSYEFAKDGDGVYYEDTWTPPRQDPQPGIFAVSADDRFVASPTVLYDVESATEVALPPALPSKEDSEDGPPNVIAMAFVPSGLARIFEDGRVDVTRAGAPQKVSLESLRCTRAVFSSTGGRLASIGWNNTTARFELSVTACEDFRLLYRRTIPHLTSGEGELACGGAHVVVDKDGLRRYGDGESEEPQIIVRARGSMRELAVSEDGRRTAAVIEHYGGGSELGVMSWRPPDVPDDRSNLTAAELGSEPSSVAFDRSGGRVVVGLRDGGVLVASLQPWKIDRRFEGPLGPIAAVRFSADGRWLYAQGRDTTIVRWPLS